MADFPKSKAKHWCCNTDRSKGVFKRENYKASHCIGSRKVSEKCVSYSDTYPVYESMVLAYLKDKAMKSQSTSKNVPKVSKNVVLDQNGTKGSPAKRKSQAKDVNKNNMCCVIKLSPAKQLSKVSSSKQKCKDGICKTSIPSLPKLANKNKKCLPCKKSTVDQKDQPSNSVVNKNMPTVSVCIRNINHANKKNSKNRIKSIERKMCVKRKLEVLSCKLEENNNMVIDVKPKRRKVAPTQINSKVIKKNKQSKTKLDISVIPGKRKKREASLNASALVNIYFEREPISPKKLKQSPSSVSEQNIESCDTSVTECKLDRDSSNKTLSAKSICSNTGLKKVSTSNAKEKSCQPSTPLKQKNGTKKMLTVEKINSMKATLTKSKINAVSLLKEEITMHKVKSCKSLDLKKIKHKLNSIRKSTDENLNVHTMMASAKYTKPITERAARIDRFCVSWIRQPCLARRHHNTAHWIEGWGKMCCTIADQASSDATSLVSKTNHQLYEEGKPSAISLQISTSSHLGNYEPARLSQVDGTQVIHMEPIQKITHLDSEIPSDDCPSSVVDVVSAHPPMKPVSRTSLCINPVYPQESSCVPPCSGFCCSPEKYVCSQYQSMTLGSINSLNTVQMMSYPQPPYRSAFTVPYSHSGLQTYGFYHGNFFQSNPSSLMQHPIHNMKTCLLPHHVPVQVPQVRVKVLIHNPDTSHECGFPDSMAAGADDENNSNANGKLKNTLKQKKRVEKKNLKAAGNDDVTMKVQKEVDESCHGWSWSGDPEWKLVQNIQVDGPPTRRKCYSAICHDDGDIIHVRDCVLLRSGPRKTDIPFIAKVAAFWEHPDDGEMMMSLLWYYRPEHTEMGRRPHNHEQEIFASKHRDENSVACIDDKAYVLTSGEFARYKAEVSRMKQGACSRKKVVPDMDDVIPNCDKVISTDVDPNTVFVCHQVYDFRQKRILKNPS